MTHKQGTVVFISVIVFVELVVSLACGSGKYVEGWTAAPVHLNAACQAWFLVKLGFLAVPHKTRLKYWCIGSASITVSQALGTGIPLLISGQANLLRLFIGYSLFGIIAVIVGWRVVVGWSRTLTNSSEQED